MSVINGVHVLWYPGETYSAANEKYCGFLMTSGDTPCQTNPKVTLPGSTRASSADAWARGTSGRGAKIVRKYPLCFEAWMLARVVAECIPLGEVVGGEPRVWLETSFDLSDSVYDGQQVLFGSGAVNTISSTARTLETGTSMWNVYLTGSHVESGPVTVSAAWDPIGLEHWWLWQMNDYFGMASVGVVKEVNADRDIDTGALTNVQWTCWYETLVTGVELVDVYHQDFDYLRWDMPVEQRAIAAPGEGEAY